MEKVFSVSVKGLKQPVANGTKPVQKRHQRYTSEAALLLCHSTAGGNLTGSSSKRGSRVAAAHHISSHSGAFTKSPHRILDLKTIKGRVSNMNMTPLRTPTRKTKASEFPLKPHSVLRSLRNELSEYEQEEILQYPEAFYLGQGAKKLPLGLKDSNYGFDDDRGDYKLVMADHIAYRYEIRDSLGSGSFGQVCACFDHKRNETVAIKVIRNKKRFHQQAALEIKTLQRLREGDIYDSFHIVRIKNYFLFRKHVCIVFELLSLNLYEHVKQQRPHGLPLQSVKELSQQILTSLKYIKYKDILHCDLKPENILLTTATSANLKVIDFGSACTMKARAYTYIQSRFYRAPEVLLGLPYTHAIDMWSFGCILAELYTTHPLFPGDSETDQFARILETLGLPHTKLLADSTRKHLFFEGDQPRLVLDHNGNPRVPSSKALESLVKSSDAPFLDLIKKCLDWDPESRLTPEGALAHLWFVGTKPTARRLKIELNHPVSTL